MRPRSLIVMLLAGAALCIAACTTYGAIGGSAMGCIVFFLLCGLSLYCSTHQEGDEAPDTDVPAHTSAVMAAPEADDASSSHPAQIPVIEEDTQDVAPVTEEQEGTYVDEGDGEEPTVAEAPDFDYEAFRRHLLTSDDSLSFLGTTVNDIRSRRDAGKTITGIEAFLFRQLEEQALLDTTQNDIPHIDVVRPHHSGLYYLRGAASRMTYGTYLSMLSIEATLNAVHFAHTYFDDLDAAREEDVYRLWQRTTNSICAQIPDVDTADWSYLAMPWQPPYGPADQGEWAVRHAMSEAIEAAQVPYRLEARFRCNVSEGDVAIEFGATPAQAFPRSSYVPGLGIVDTTSEMRRREASAYAARVGILLANHAFRSSTKIRRVWVAAIEETPTSHRCLYSVCVGRRAFSRLRMAGISDPLAALRSLGASFDEVGGVFVPTKPLFYLEDKMFCPPHRYDLWNLSERSLPVSAVQALGASRVSGLLIHEELPRTLAADDALRGLADPSTSSATQTSVRSIMDVARRTSDLSVWSAATHVANELIEGHMGLDDPEAIRDEFIGGDALTKAVERAQMLLMRQEPAQALTLLATALAPIDDHDLYTDTDAVAYRCFDSFTERVLYNRLNAHDKRSVVLVPDAYLMAHLILSALYMSFPEGEGGNKAASLHHAHRALQIAPLNGPANLGMAACLEALEEFEGAQRQLMTFLETACHPQSMGIAYFKLASLVGREGDLATAQACYQRSVRLFPPLFPFAMGEYQTLFGDDSGEDVTIELLDDQKVEQILQDKGIPLAPTSQTSFILYDGATASIDAEVFPVAHDLMRLLEMLTGDDVIRGIRLSLEHEPDL